MQPFATDHDDHDDQRRDRRARRADKTLHRELCAQRAQPRASAPVTVVSALRRCRQPVPRARGRRARPARASSRPIAAASPADAVRVRRPVADVGKLVGGSGRSGRRQVGRSRSRSRIGPAHPAHPAFQPSWDRDEWDVVAHRRRGVPDLPGSRDRRVVHRCDCGLITMNHGGRGGH